MPADSKKQSEEVKEYDQRAQPNTTKRGRTNLPCLVVFVICLFYLAYILAFAFKHGDPRRFAGLPDYSGHVCGLSSMVEDKPFLYFCQDETGALDRRNRVCVESCPGSFNAMNMQNNIECPLGSSTMYTSKAFAGIYCMPEDPELRKELHGVYTGYKSVKLFTWVSEAYVGWFPIIIAVAVSVVLSMLYLWFVQDFSQCLVWTGLGIVILGTAGSGVYLLHTSQEGGYDQVYGTHDARIDFWWGVSLLCTSALFLFIATTGQKSVRVADSCIKAAVQCIWDVESILFQPWLAMAIRVPVLGFLLWGLAHLLSCVVYEDVDDGSSTGLEVVSASESSRDVQIRIHYTSKEYSYIGFYIFMLVWISEFLTAFSHYVVAYATEVWFFTPFASGNRSKKTPPYVTCSAYADGMKYHLGTLAMGSFIIMFARGPRMCLRVIAYCSRQSENAFLKSVCCLCGCCIGVYDGFVKVLTKDAWMDLAMNGNPFCQAAYHSLLVLEHEATTAITMHGACWIIQCAGVSLITFCGAAITFLICSFHPLFSIETSEYFIEEPIFLSLLSGFISAVVAMPFLQLFNDVSDTILFCFALQQRRASLKPIIVQVYDRACCGRSQTDPLAKVERRLDQPPEAQALIDKVKKEEQPYEKPKDRSCLNKEKDFDRSCLDKTRACGH